MMSKTLTVSLVGLLTIASMSAAGTAPAAGLHRGDRPAQAGGLNRSGRAAAVTSKNFGAFHRAQRHGRFLGSLWIGAAPYDTPAADVSVDNNQLVVHAPPSRCVCRTQAIVVPREAGGAREVTVTRCLLE